VVKTYNCNKFDFCRLSGNEITVIRKAYNCLREIRQYYVHRDIRVEIYLRSYVSGVKRYHRPFKSCDFIIFPNVPYEEKLEMNMSSD